MKAIAILCATFGVFIVITVFSLFGGIIALPFHAVNNGIDTAHGIIDKTLNADNALYNYEWFKQQIQDVKATELKARLSEDAVASFESASGPRSAWTFEDKTEDARLRSIALGLRAQYENQVADYNAHASMANRSIFESGLIPNLLEVSASLIH